MVAFHDALAHRAVADSQFQYHYVTTRELYNLVKAAEAGWTGGVNDARDFALTWGGGNASESSIEQAHSGVNR